MPRRVRVENRFVDALAALAIIVQDLSHGKNSGRASPGIGTIGGGTMRESDKLLLVGSIPLETAPEVFDMFGAPLSRWLDTMPDGEVGHRRHWISRVHYEVLAAHPQLEVVQHPAPENGV